MLLFHARMTSHLKPEENVLETIYVHSNQAFELWRRKRELIEVGTPFTPLALLLLTALLLYRQRTPKQTDAPV